MEKIGSMPWGHTCPHLLWQLSKAERIRGMLAGVTDCRRSQKWAAKEDGRWDLNLGPAAIEMSRPHGSEVNGRTTRL